VGRRAIGAGLLAMLLCWMVTSCVRRPRTDVHAPNDTVTPTNPKPAHSPSSPPGTSGVRNVCMGVSNFSSVTLELRNVELPEAATATACRNDHCVTLASGRRFSTMCRVTAWAPAGVTMCSGILTSSGPRQD
jgi:ABC-type nickel/cobalt efflux system permease component RcnA